MPKWDKSTHTDDNEFNGHEEPEEVEDDLQHRPLGGLHEPPCARGEDEGVPCSDGERTDEEVLVRAQMGRQVEGGREERRDIRHCFCLLLRCSSSQQDKKIIPTMCRERAGGRGCGVRYEDGERDADEEGGGGKGGRERKWLYGRRPDGERSRGKMSTASRAEFWKPCPFQSRTS